MNQVSSVQSSMQCTHDPNRDRSIQMKPPIWSNPDRFGSNHSLVWPFHTLKIESVGVTGNMYTCWYVMVVEHCGNNAFTFQTLVLVINDYGTISTLCVNGCVGLNKVGLGLSHIGQSVYSVKVLLQTTSLCFSIAKSTLKVPLIFLKVEKTKCENCNFVHFLPFIFFFVTHNSKLYGVCEYYTYQTAALLLNPEIFLYWFGVAYELWLASYNHRKVP